MRVSTHGKRAPRNDRADRSTREFRQYVAGTSPNLTSVGMDEWVGGWLHTSFDDDVSRRCGRFSSRDEQTSVDGAAGRRSVRARLNDSMSLFCHNTLRDNAHFRARVTYARSLARSPACGE